MFWSEGQHMGHVIIDCMKKRPDEINQIDAATGESETNASVLERSIRLALAIRKLGLIPGDILALGGKNHLDLHIPYYAGLLNGLPIVGVDPLFKYDEILTVFKLTKPRIAFCDPEQYTYFVEAAKNLNLNTKIIQFGLEDNSFADFLETYKDDTPVEAFEPAIFDQDKIYAWLVSSGGTTGVIKMAAIKHKTVLLKMQMLVNSFFKKQGIDLMSLPASVALHLSPVQWISGFFHPFSMPITNQTKLTTSAPVTADNVIDMINKYKPVSSMLGPSLVSSLLKSEKHCDWSCFQNIVMSGGKVYTDLILDLKKRLRKDALVMEVYGQTENLGPVLTPNPFGPIGCCGKPDPNIPVKLVDPETGKEITEPNVTGELWAKAEGFSEYYNNPEETRKAFSEDGWYKTGDLLYRDENDNYFFVERIKMLIKYRNYHIVPPELEEVIRCHPGVAEVSVTSVTHREDGEHAVACVVPADSSLTPEHIHALVAEKLSETKQLRGGVIFMEALPMTSAGKVARGKLKQMVFEIMKNRQ